MAPISPCVSLQPLFGLHRKEADWTNEKKSTKTSWIQHLNCVYITASHSFSFCSLFCALSEENEQKKRRKKRIEKRKTPFASLIRLLFKCTTAYGWECVWRKDKKKIIISERFYLKNWWKSVKLQMIYDISIVVFFENSSDSYPSLIFNFGIYI